VVNKVLEAVSEVPAGVARAVVLADLEVAAGLADAAVSVVVADLADVVPEALEAGLADLAEPTTAWSAIEEIAGSRVSMGWSTWCFTIPCSMHGRIPSTARTCPSRRTRRNALAFRSAAR